MPVYEYKCQKCHQTFEVEQRMSDQPLTAHAECGGYVRRVLQASGIVFKGSGFHMTDYRKDPPKTESPPKTEAKPETKPETKPESKTDTKPETKS